MRQIVLRMVIFKIDSRLLLQRRGKVKVELLYLTSKTQLSSHHLEHHGRAAKQEINLQSKSLSEVLVFPVLTT